MAQVHTPPTIHNIELDLAQDMLFIEFEPIDFGTYYMDVDDDRDVIRRYSFEDDRFVGISMMNAEYRLGSDNPSPAAIRQLAENLVARYG